MKTAYTHIYQLLKVNRIIVFCVLVLGLGSTLFSGVLTYIIYHESLDGAFILNSEGNAIPLKWTKTKDNLEVETLSHLELFHTYFYHLEPSNYERQLDRALWLGNASVSEAYLQKKSEGIYNRLLQYSLVQRVLGVRSEIDLSASPYTFQTTTLFEVHRGSVVDSYELVTTGKLMPVERHFPNNPHGLLITDYFEKSLKKLNHENR